MVGVEKAEILVIGRSRDALSEILAQLEGQRPIAVGARVFANGHGELWSHHEPMPHALVLCVGEDWPETLPVLLAALPVNRPPFLVACPASDWNCSRWPCAPAHVMLCRRRTTPKT